MKHLKVVSVYNRYLNRGGEDEVFESEARLLNQNGCSVTLITEHVSAPHGPREKIGMALDAVWSRSWFDKFQSLLREVGPDLVHVHNVFPVMSPSIYYACREAGVPVVQTLHNYRLFCPAATFFRDGQICEECVQHSLWRSVRYACYRNSRPATATVALTLAVHRRRGTWARLVDCYIALTEFARQKFIEVDLPAGKIVVKPNFVYPDPGARNGRGEYALFVGRLSPEKGLRTLLAAWQRLRNCVPLRIVGEGPLRPELEAVASRRSLSNISFEGRLPRDKTVEAIKSARLLVFPSEWYETFGLAIAETFACSVPVVASRLGAVEEIVEDGRTGLHFTPGDPDDLAAKVEWAWTHPERMEEMGRAARAEYEAKYTAERNYQLLMDIYQRAIAAHKAD